MNVSARRDFLRGTTSGMAAIALGSTVPSLLCEAAQDAGNDDRILLVVELAGGNDGLNSVIPHSDPAYQRARPELGIAKRDTLSVRNGIGLHTSMRGFADLLEQGHFAVVQGVGYKNPNRSHFESMDIWHTCQRKDQNRTDGWIGRALETIEQPGGDPAAIHFGAEEQPYALTSRDVRVPSIQSLEQFRFQGDAGPRFAATVRELSSARSEERDDLLGFLKSSTGSAIDASERLGAASKLSKTGADYPATGLGKKLATVAKLIASGMNTKIYYVRIDGFDTHANQPAAHAALLREVSDAVTALIQDLISQGQGDRLLAMCFSEFGRRVAENASAGTDHGTAGPMFFAGTKVNAGLIGRHPSLNDLDEGDLKFHTDFRQVYATVLEDWLGCPSRTALLKGYDKIRLLA